MSTYEEVRALLEKGLSHRKIADVLGVSRGTVSNHAARIRREGLLTPMQIARLAQQGVSGEALASVNAVWFKSQPDKDTGLSESVLVNLRDAPEIAQRFEDAAAATLEAMAAHAPRTAPPLLLRSPEANLAVIDVADLHIGKLATAGGAAAEVAEGYDCETAVSRARLGVRKLIEKLRAHGFERSVLVIGNDVLHADRWNGTTTAGTKQDTDGDWATWFDIARAFYVEVIELLAECGDVHVVFCPSNHDWQSGWYLAQTIRAWFRHYPTVHFGPDGYNVSRRHRKYLVFQGALLGFTHGDGAKEADLGALMQQEQRLLWGQTRYAYWYTHHLHHKRKTVYLPRPEAAERDTHGVTIIGKVTPNPDAVQVEVVRSPSPADGWHDRNGYVNQQAVECFLHDGRTGAQFARFTEWF